MQQPSNGTDHGTPGMVRGVDNRKSWSKRSSSNGNNNCQLVQSPSHSGGLPGYSVTSGQPPRDDSRRANLEKLIYDLIVTQGQRERALINQITNLQAELNRRSVAFQQTVNHFQRRLQQTKSKKQAQEERQAVSGDSDSGLGEEHLSLHLAVILHRQNGSLGFNVSSGCPSSSPSQQHTKDLHVSFINSDGPAKGKLLMHDKILKVNGFDISEASHEEAVATFKSAVEPIVVEVTRLLQGWPRLQDAATQTGVTSPPPATSSSPPPPPPHGVVEQCSSPSENCDSKVNGGKSSDESLEEELHKYDIEYEEVTLAKSNAETKLGLTLCCAEESESDVFIGEVDWSSIAGRDGRIQNGDQIIQINGVDVQTKNHAVQLFEAESPVVSLVVARPHLREEGRSQDMSKESYDCLHNVSHYQYHSSPMVQHQPQSILEEEEDEVEREEGENCKQEVQSLRPTETEWQRDVIREEDEEEYANGAVGEMDTAFSSLEKDSGVGGGKTTDGSTLNEEEGSERGSAWPDTRANRNTAGSQRSRTGHGNSSKASQKSEVTPVAVNQNGVLLPTTSGRSSTGPATVRSEAVEQWVESTAAVTNGSLGRRPLLDEELCLGMFLPPPPSERDPDDALSVYSCDCCRMCDSGDAASSVYGGVSRRRSRLPIPPANATVYTDRTGLARTIKLQQQLFRRALLASTEPAHDVVAAPPSPSRKSPSSPGRSVATSPSREAPSPLLRSPSTSTTTSSSQSGSTPTVTGPAVDVAAQEWKVKLRSDGSRHIVRRPVRSRQLRERASRVAEERCGVTTDDDAVSELKIGRYWTKDERRHHLERARQRQQQRQELLRARVDLANSRNHHHGGGGESNGRGDGGGESGAASSPQGILELSRRKMMRIKDRTLFDDFTTVQEVLVHGSRTIAGGAKVPHSLLSVTTV